MEQFAGFCAVTANCWEQAGGALTGSENLRRGVAARRVEGPAGQFSCDLADSNDASTHPTQTPHQLKCLVWRRQISKT
jgi:hypothetical protein